MFSEFPLIFYFLAALSCLFCIARMPAGPRPVKYKESIQGCISVLFSYLIGSVMRFPAGQERKAEKEGFEPSRRFSRPTPFPGEPLRPLGYFSKNTVQKDTYRNGIYKILHFEKFQKAERMGFEPMCPLRQTDFESAPL